MSKVRSYPTRAGLYRRRLSLYLPSPFHQYLPLQSLPFRRSIHSHRRLDALAHYLKCVSSTVSKQTLWQIWPIFGWPDLAWSYLLDEYTNALVRIILFAPICHLLRLPRRGPSTTASPSSTVVKYDLRGTSQALFWPSSSPQVRQKIKCSEHQLHAAAKSESVKRVKLAS